MRLVGYSSVTSSDVRKAHPLTVSSNQRYNWWHYEYKWPNAAPSLYRVVHKKWN